MNSYNSFSFYNNMNPSQITGAYQRYHNDEISTDSGQSHFNSPNHYHEPEMEVAQYLNVEDSYNCKNVDYLHVKHEQAQFDKLENHNTFYQPNNQIHDMRRFPNVPFQIPVGIQNNGNNNQSLMSSFEAAQKLIGATGTDDKQQNIMFEQIMNQTQLGREMYSKLIQKRKRIMKREKAQNRVTSRNTPVSSVPSQYDTAAFTTQNIPLTSSNIQQHLSNSSSCFTDVKMEQLDDRSDDGANESQIGNMNNNSSNCSSNNNPHESKSQKKIAQMIRNRMSAQKSRDNKKMYIQNLQASNQTLQKERDELLLKLTQLQQRSMGAEQQNGLLLNEIRDVKFRAKQFQNLVCNKCGNNDFSFYEDYFSDPEFGGGGVSSNSTTSCASSTSGGSPISNSGNSHQLGGVPRNFASLGIAFFALFSVFLLMNNINSSSQDGGNSTVLTNIPTSPVLNDQINSPNNNKTTELLPSMTQSKQQFGGIIVEEEYKLFQPKQDLPVLEIIKKNSEHHKILMAAKYLRDQGIPFEIVDEKMSVVEKQGNGSTLLVKFDKKSMKQNLRGMTLESQEEEFEQMGEDEDLINLPISRTSIRTQDFSTVYCPQPYKFQNLALSGKKNMQLNLKTNDWIQLIIPKSDVSLFDCQNDEVIISNSSSEQFRNDCQDQFYEVWAQVKHTNERDFSKLM